MFFGHNGGQNWKNTTKIGHFRINEHNYLSGHVISEIPTATPILATMPNSTVPSSTLTESADSQKTKWPRLNRKYIVSLDMAYEITTKSQWPHIFDHARRRYATVDIARHRSTWGTENGGDTNQKRKQPMSNDLGS